MFTGELGNRMKSIRYRDRKLKTIDGYFVARATKEETGLPYDILVDSLGADKRLRYCPGIPRIGVIVDDTVISVSIDESPAILSGSKFAESEKVLEWVAHFREPLLDHWNKELDDLEILTTISNSL